MAAPRPLALRAETFYDGLGGPPRSGVTVVVTGGVISSVLESESEGHETPPGSELIDLGPGHTLLPGLIDAHVHLMCTGGPGALPETIERTDAELQRRAHANAMTAFRAGVTTMRDCGGRGDVTLKVRDQLRAATYPTPDLMVAGMPVTTRNGHLSFCGIGADSSREIERAVDRLIGMDVDFIKVMASAGIQTPGNDPGTSQYDEAALSTLVERAHEAGRHVAAHAHSVRSIRDSISARVDTVEHFSWLGAGASDSELQELAVQARESGIYVDPTAIALDAGSSEEAGLSPWEQNLMKLAMEQRKRVLPMLSSTGVKLIAGTDAGSAGVGFCDMGKGLQILSDIIGWRSGEVGSAINSATYAAACAMGLGHVVGSIQAGMRADLILVKGDLGTSLAAVSSPALVVKDGQVMGGPTATATSRVQE